MKNVKFEIGKFWPSEFVIPAGLAVAKFLIHLISSTTYEFHRDEFLYIALGKHLGWGYLEVPPFIAVVAAAARGLLGESVMAYRFFPALAGAGTVFFTGIIARELGGKRFAQLLAGLSVIVSPAFLRSGTLFQPVVFDQFFWVLGMYLIVKILGSEFAEKPTPWLFLGIVGGLGLLNKYTMLLFAGGVFAGLLISPHRSLLGKKWPWIAVEIALLIALPNLIWQHQQGWPLVEHMRVLSQTQLTNVAPGEFMLGQVLMLMFGFPLVLFGLYYTLIDQRGYKYRAMGWMYMVILSSLLLLAGKIYYLLPVYPVLLAAGAVQLELLLRSSTGRLVRWAVPVILILGNMPSIPYGLPIISHSSFESYAKSTSELPVFAEALRWEDGKLHSLPQDYADMIGWRNLAVETRWVYAGLSPEEQKKTIIFASNYGEAGCLDYYREEFGLPEVYSINGSFYLWGPPSQGSQIIITVGYKKDDLLNYFAEVSAGIVITHRYARESTIPVYICRQRLESLENLWKRFEGYQY